MYVSANSPYADPALTHRLGPGVYCGDCSAGVFKEAAMLAATEAFGDHVSTAASE
jgi:hypothetical protein